MISIGLNTGYKIFSISEKWGLSNKKFDGGFSIVEILGTSNILLLVGDNKSSAMYSNEICTIFDDETN